MLKLKLCCTYQKHRYFYNSSQKRCPAVYMKESNGSKTYILLSSEIGWGTELKIGRLVSLIEMYRHVTIH